MIFKIVISLIALFLILIIFAALFNAFVYPVVQFFKRKNEFGYVLDGLGGYEHRVKVENMIGRKLSPNEEVHHINGKKWDNRKSNLALMTRSNHQRWHKRLEWMYGKNKFPSIKTQRKKLIEEFSAILF
jgi:HNH endonuclease